MAAVARYAAQLPAKRGRDFPARFRTASIGFSTFQQVFNKVFNNVFVCFFSLYRYKIVVFNFSTYPTTTTTTSYIIYVRARARVAFRVHVCARLE